VNTVNDLRLALSDDVRRLQPPAGLEARVLQQALQGSRDVVSAHRAELPNVVPLWEPRRRGELAAGIAAILLAAIVIGSFAYIRAATRPHTVAPPITGPSPTLTRPLNVDPGTPVILFTDAGNPYQIDGMTWDGRSGTIAQVPKSRPTSYAAESSNAAGTLFVAFPNIIDRSGRVVTNLTGGPYAPNSIVNDFLGAWADDEQHYCQVIPASASGAKPEPGTLQLTTPGGSPREVVQVGNQGPSGTTLYATVCSVLGDRAIVVERDDTHIQYWVVQLSSGHVLWTHTFADTCPPAYPTVVTACGIPNVVASRDGRYVAEVQPTGVTTFLGPNGSPVGYVNGLVRAFSWDGSLAVVSGLDGGVATVIRWSDGTVIWTAPPTIDLGGVQAQPNGTSLAILTDSKSPDNPSASPSGVLYVVSSDGHVIGQQDVAGRSLLACLPITCAGGAW
jgi:hypothetical protein